ncbi:hypothetical protein, partial [Nocardia colli]|uniref:hypothetical protein n=1 Tax=Nocardia colli TaxID=2545717 RepID=UPI0035DD2D79
MDPSLRRSLAEASARTGAPPPRVSVDRRPDPPRRRPDPDFELASATGCFGGAGAATGTPDFCHTPVT